LTNISKKIEGFAACRKFKCNSIEVCHIHTSTSMQLTILASSQMYLVLSKDTGKKSLGKPMGKTCPHLSFSEEHGTRFLENYNSKDEIDSEALSKLRINLTTADGSMVPYVAGYWPKKTSHFHED